MTRYAANSSFLRQMRAEHGRRTRQLEHDDDRARILAQRIIRAGVDPADPQAPELAAAYLLRETCLRNVRIALTGDRLWIGDGQTGNGAKHQAGLGLLAMEACVRAWEGDHRWDELRPDGRVMISVRDWLEPVERWSWDVRRTGELPVGQPAYW